MQHDTCTNTTLIEAFMGTLYSRHPHDLQPDTHDKIVNVLENYAESRKVKDFGSRTFIFQFDPGKIIKELRSDLRNIDGFNQFEDGDAIVSNAVGRMHDIIDIDTDCVFCKYRDENSEKCTRCIAKSTNNFEVVESLSKKPKGENK